MPLRFSSHPRFAIANAEPCDAMPSLFVTIQRLFGSFHFDATPLLLLAPRLLRHAKPIITPAVRSSSELGRFYAALRFADRGSACVCRCLALPPQIFSAYRAALA